MLRVQFFSWINSLYHFLSSLNLTFSFCLAYRMEPNWSPFLLLLIESSALLMDSVFHILSQHIKSRMHLLRFDIIHPATIFLLSSDRLIDWLSFLYSTYLVVYSLSISLYSFFLPVMQCLAIVFVGFVYLWLMISFFIIHFRHTSAQIKTSSLSIYLSACVTVWIVFDLHYPGFWVGIHSIELCMCVDPLYISICNPFCKPLFIFFPILLHSIVQLFSIHVIWVY